MTPPRALAVELDAIGNTRPLWLAWLESAQGVLGIDPATVPANRVEAAAALDSGGAGNWRTLLARFAEDHAPAYLRRDARTSAALQSLADGGVPVGVFTDAPAPLADVALAQLGATRRVAAVATGAAALERLLETIGADADVVRSRNDLLSQL